MRRLVNLMSRLERVCVEDASEQARFRDSQQRDLMNAERDMRARAEQGISSAHELSNPKSLGGRLRAELARQVHAVHEDPGAPPLTFDDAIAEWVRVAPSVERRVRDFLSAHQMWQRRLLKRARSAPSVESDVWHGLDRLDLIHRTMPALTQAMIAHEIQAVSDSANVFLQAENVRRKEGQLHLADELKNEIAEIDRHLPLSGADWSDSRWKVPLPAHRVERFVRVGELVGDLPTTLGIRGIPALIDFPLRAGVSVRSTVDSRSQAFGLIRALMIRLLAAVPPGLLELKIVDPVALGQSVAEFRHLAEYDERLVDEKTWTSERDIERLLDELTDHVEVVISQYLKGQFETIAEYNEHAGEVAQPYRVLVVFDFPNSFTDRAARRLLSLVENGPRCGIFTILHFTDDSVANGRVQPSTDRIASGMNRITANDIRWQLELPDPVGVLGSRLMPDQAPPITFDVGGRPETGSAHLIAAVGASSRAGHERRTAVTLGSLLPVLARSRAGVLPEFESSDAVLDVDPSTWWRATTVNAAVAPFGRSGAQQVAGLRFSSTDIAGGAIIVGLPRSGKTTSLHAVILTMAMLYAPDELELYLIDAKHGVEFKTYEFLPHARMVSINSDRVFSLAILKALEEEIRRRAEVMKMEGSRSASITDFRAVTGESLARIVLIMDEFHELFEEPDRIGLEAFAAFSNIVRMGPFSGVHVVVASQTLSSMPAMDRPTLMLLPQRVAFTCTDYDAEVLMGSANQAALRLSKTGEGVFNPARGEESRNQLFQGLHISAGERIALLNDLKAKARETGWTRLPRVFDGDAVIPRPPLQIDSKRFASRVLIIDVGEPLSLEDRERVVVRRTRGSNLLILGSDTASRDRALQGALHSCLLAASTQAATVTVVDFAGDDDEYEAGSLLVNVVEALGGTYVRSGGATGQLEVVAGSVEARISKDDYGAETEVLVIVGLERARLFEPPDPYEDGGTRSVARTLLTVLENGPEVGIHTVLQANRAKTVEDRLGPSALSEFSLRLGSSITDRRDLAVVAGQYGDVDLPRMGQLLVCDLTIGSVKRVRGYAALVDGDLVAFKVGKSE